MKVWMVISAGFIRALGKNYQKIYIFSWNFPNKGAGGMKLASDFKLPFSCFSSNLGNFSPIRVEMCYS